MTPTDNFYQPLSGNEMPRFGGIASMMRLPHAQDAEGLDACFVGVPFDLGTPATLASGLYQGALEKAGHSVLVLEDHDFQDCVDAIALVKANEMAAAFTAVSRCIRKLMAAGARAVTLGCTELPPAVPHHRRDEFECVLTDSIDALAKQVVSVFRPSFRIS